MLQKVMKIFEKIKIEKKGLVHHKNIVAED